MSDGPHRSLPMRKPWRELAKRGDQATYDAEQVAEAAADALASDFKNEVKWSLINALKSTFTGRDNSLGLLEIALQELEAAKALPFTAVPYTIKLEDGRNAENSARSRGFRFSVVSTMSAYLIDAPSVIVPESGQGALAPALLPVGQGYEDYRSHPIFAALMERFFKALLGYQIQYRFPQLWKTKGETLREFVDVCGNDVRLTKTRSCWQQSRQVTVSSQRRQCGVCAACMLRRLSVHAAGLSESPENYVWESLQADAWEAGAAENFTKFTPALREYAIAGVLHFEHFALLRDSMQYELVKRRATNELARTLSEPSTVVAKNLDRLLQQHATEWSAFIDNLGPRSFVRHWIDGAS